MNIGRAIQCGSLALTTLLLVGCGNAPGSGATGGAGSSAGHETADQFVARLNKDLNDLSLDVNQTGWLQATYINDDSQGVAARSYDRYLAYFNAAVKQAKAYDGQPLSVPSKRAIDLLKEGVSTPAPDDPALRAELTTLATKLDADYGKAKFCLNGDKNCLGIDGLGGRGTGEDPQLRRGPEDLDRLA
jgi:peptidyl-dipeptidase A